METIILPRGTLLFRGVVSPSKMVSDYTGILSGKDTYCLSKNFNVFFYPYPFVANTVGDFSYNYIIIYFTQRDLKLINLVSPSKFSREDRNHDRGGITSCNSLPAECGVTGFAYDPCVDYSKAPGDIAGMVAIAQQDAGVLNMYKYEYQPYFNKYFTTFKDNRGLVGVPEIILHPRFIDKQKNEKIPDFSKWYESNKKDLNYLFLHKVENEIEDLEDFMKKITSTSGIVIDGKTYHVKVNKQTSFFQIVEASDTFPIAERGLSVKYSESTLTRKNMMKSESSVGPIKKEKTLDPRMIDIDYNPYKHLNEHDNSYIEAGISPEYMPMFSKFFKIYRQMFTTYINYNKKIYSLHYTGNRQSDEEYLPRQPSTFEWLTGKDITAENKEKQRKLIERAKQNITIMTLEGGFENDYKMVGFINNIFRKYLAKQAKGGRRKTRRRLS